MTTKQNVEGQATNANYSILANMLKKIFFSTLIVSLLSTALFAQEPEIESILESTEDYSDVTNLSELLAELEDNPLDLNTATAKQLALLPWISEILAWEIIRYRERFGNFAAVEELEKFSKLDAESIPLLKKYLVVTKPSMTRDFSLNLKSRASRKIEQSKGLQNGYYYPSPEKIYHRLNCHYGDNLTAGALFEKDSGERRIDDFTTYFFKYSMPNNFEFIVGNYLLECGQGLVFWNPYGPRKSNNPIFAAKNQSRHLHEYMLADENASLYGMASKLNFRFIELLLFYSSQKIDANLSDNMDEVNSFYTSGYHRNETENNKKDQLTEVLYGFRLEASPRSGFSLGTTAYQSRYDRRFINDDLIRQRFTFTGTENQVISVDYNYSQRFFNVYGELAQSQNRGRGLLAGVLLDAKNIKLTLLYRNYGKDFISLHSSSFGENSGKPMNEQGFYFGMKLTLLKNATLSLYFDAFKFPWRTYFIPMPSNGNEMFAALTVKPAKKLCLYLHLKAKQKDETVNLVNAFSLTDKIILPRKQVRLRLQIDYEPRHKIELRQRIEKNWVRYQKYFDVTTIKNPLYSGILLYQDIYCHMTPRLALAYRLTYFDTDGYEARLYEMERDVPGILTNQLLYGQGTRWYIFARFMLSTSISVSLKYGSTHYYFTNQIGTAADAISGDSVNSINLQIEARLP